MFAYICRNVGRGVKEYIYSFDNTNYYHSLPWEVRILTIIFGRDWIFLYIPI